MPRLRVFGCLALLTWAGAQTLEERLIAVEESVQSMTRHQVVLWIMVGVLVTLVLQIPYSLLELSVPGEHTYHPLVRNALLSATISLAWYALGWALAYGHGNVFLGTSNFFLTTNGAFPGDQGWSYAHFLFGWAIVCLIGVIISSIMSTRVTFRTHALFWALLAIWIQPIPAHWIWSHSGWLAPNSHTWNLGQNGVLDWGGAAPIHVVAGSLALTATWYLGPRVASQTADPLEAVRLLQANQNRDLLCTAHFLMIVGFLCLNSVPGLFCKANDQVAEQWIAIPRALALGMVGMFTGPLALWVSRWIITGRLPTAYSILPRDIMNSILVALFSLSGGGAFVEAWAAIPIGGIGVGLFFGLQWTLAKSGLDDPHDLIALHMTGGFWGTIACGVFAWGPNIRQALGLATTSGGMITGGGLEQLAVQSLGFLVVLVWTLLHGAFFFTAMNFFKWLYPGDETHRRPFTLFNKRPRSESLEAVPFDRAPGSSNALAPAHGTPEIPPMNSSSMEYHELETPAGKMLNDDAIDQLPPPSSVPSGDGVDYAPANRNMNFQHEEARGQIPGGGWSYS